MIEERQTMDEAIDSAFDVEEQSVSPEPEPTPDTPEETPAEETKASEPAEETPLETDELTEHLTPEQIAEMRKDPRLDSIYRGLMKKFTPATQELSQLRRLFGAIQDPGTRKQALKALGAVVGAEIELREEEKREQQEQASQIADNLSEEWSKVVGPEAAELLRPLIEKTAQAAIAGQFQPLQQATVALQQDARNRQAQAQVAQFKAFAETEGWKVTPEVEAKMFALGQELQPAKPIETVDQGVSHLKMLYKLATADEALSNAEKRVLERMDKAAKSVEPARGVSSANRESKSRIKPGMSLDEALDIAVEEETAGLRAAPSF